MIDFEYLDHYDIRDLERIMALLRTPGKQYAQRGSSGSADLAAMQAGYMSEAEINYQE